jgi:hypothetical protein
MPKDDGVTGGSHNSRPFPRPERRMLTVKVINHFGREVIEEVTVVRLCAKEFGSASETQ